MKYQAVLISWIIANSCSRPGLYCNMASCCAYQSQETLHKVTDPVSDVIDLVVTQLQSERIYHSSQLHSDMIDHVTQLQSARIDYVTLKLGDVIDHVTLKLGDVIDHVTLKLSDVIDHVTVISDFMQRIVGH